MHIEKGFICHINNWYINDWIYKFFSLLWNIKNINFHKEIKIMEENLSSQTKIELGNSDKFEDKKEKEESFSGTCKN